MRSHPSSLCFRDTASHKADFSKVLSELTKAHARHDEVCMKIERQQEEMKKERREARDEMNKERREFQASHEKQQDLMREERREFRAEREQAQARQDSLVAKMFDQQENLAKLASIVESQRVEISALKGSPDAKRYQPPHVEDGIIQQKTLNSVMKAPNETVTETKLEQHVHEYDNVVAEKKTDDCDPFSGSESQESCCADLEEEVEDITSPRGILSKKIIERNEELLKPLHPDAPIDVITPINKKGSSIIRARQEKFANLAGEQKKSLVREKTKQNSTLLTLPR